MTKRQKRKALRYLVKARELMNNRGKHWMQGKLRSGENFCAVGGIAHVAGVAATRMSGPRLSNKTLATQPELSFALAKLAEAIDPSYTQNAKSSNSRAQSTIIGFNDNSHTTWGQVSKVFRKAAKQLEKELAT